VPVDPRDRPAGLGGQFGKDAEQCGLAHAAGTVYEQDTARAGRLVERFPEGFQFGGPPHEVVLSCLPEPVSKRSLG
jgi:hypothetical protein